MGTKQTSTVYAAELQGINLALSMVQTHSNTKPGMKIHIFADHQAAIRSLVRPEGRSGAYIVRQIAQKITALHEAGATIDVHWIPAHEGIEGNS